MPRRYAFPRPLLGRAGCDFSFSGLKTAVAQEVARHGTGALPVQVAADIAASFQRAVAEVLADRAAHAMAMMRERAPEARVLVVAGGVAANGAMRAALAEAASGAGLRAGGAAGAAVHRQCGDGGVDGDRAAAAGAGGWAGVRAAAAVAAVNYRHAFHAGNFADCVKHAVLVWLLRALQRKPAPLFVLDTHAGAGRYDLATGPAARTGEWRDCAPRGSRWLVWHELCES